MNFNFSTQNKDLDFDRAVFPISVVAEVLGIHQRTLRIYDELSILTPSRSNNRRKYSLNNIEKGKFINYLTRNLGINLTGVKLIINLLSKENVNYKEQIEYVKKIAIELNITER